MASIRGLGVKYWPAPDLRSLALRSSRPSYMSPSPPSLAEYQSSRSISATRVFRFFGLVMQVWALAKISRTRSEPWEPRWIRSVL